MFDPSLFALSLLALEFKHSLLMLESFRLVS